MAINPFSTISELGEMLRRKQVSSLELTRFYLDRLEKHGESLGAVVTITRELAETQARAADSKIAAGNWLGPLHGIPFGVKDLLATKGIPTTWGAEPYREQVFDYDAEVVRRLTDAGAILCAKLAMVELAGGFGYNTADASFTGPGRTPWNTEFWSGGSSSGPGASVGAALVPFAIGSETSGSILTPAAFSGVSGFRPSYGVVSRNGAMALSWTLDKLGPICRSIDDCRAVMSVIAGHDPKDESSLRDELDWSGKSVGKSKIGIIKTTYEETQPEVRANFEASIGHLRRLGHEVVEMTLPEFPYGQCVSTIVDAEGASAFEDLLNTGRAKMLTVAQDKIGGFEGAATLAVDYLRAMRIRKKIRLALTAVFTNEVDFIAAPTRSTVSYPIGKLFREVYPDIRSSPSTIGSMNLVGAPAAALPNGLGENGLPTSVQLIGGPLRDAEVLGLAAQWQNAIAFHDTPTGY